ncbi:MAG: hypothetical protein PHI11_02765 [Gallionella sp.]|nr:hypothetical protein [Gallionella sp.]
MKPDVVHVYAVLRQWATAGKPQTYKQLSLDYRARTDVWFEPHGSWEAPLGELNNLLASAGAPALSALVVLQEKKEPGDGFWGCASNVPSRPKKDIDRLAEWSRIVAAVIAFQWPSTLP